MCSIVSCLQLKLLITIYCGLKNKIIATLRLTSTFLMGRLSVTNLSSENNLLPFPLNAPVVIRWKSTSYFPTFQVIFQAQVDDRQLSLHSTEKPLKVHFVALSSSWSCDHSHVDYLIPFWSCMVANASSDMYKWLPLASSVAMETNLITPVTQELHEIFECPVGHITVVVTPLTSSCRAVA